MPKRKTDTAINDATAVEKVKRAKRSLADAYKNERPKVDPVLLREGRQFGSHNITFTPAYEPEGFSMAWVDVPSGDPVRDERFYRMVGEEGYVLMRPEHVADSYEEAVEEGLYYFRVKLDTITVDGTDAVGFSGRGIVAVWRPKEIADKMRQRNVEQFKRMLTAEGARHPHLDVSVTEGKSTLGDVASSNPSD